MGQRMLFQMPGANSWEGLSVSYVYYLLCQKPQLCVFERVHTVRDKHGPIGKLRWQGRLAPSSICCTNGMAPARSICRRDACSSPHTQKQLLSVVVCAVVAAWQPQHLKCLGVSTSIKGCYL